MEDPIRFPDWREILDSLMGWLPAVWRQVTGKVSQRLLVAFALALEGVYGALQRVLRLAFPATSEGEWLRAIARSWGMEPFEGVAASVQVQCRAFTPREQPVYIPAGTRLRAAQGVEFVTTEAAVIEVGQTTAIAPARCTQPGTQGNIPAYAIVGLVTPVPGVDEVSNPAPAYGGIDAEPDAALKARIPIHLAGLHRATIAAIEGKVVSDRQRFPEVVRFVSERNFDYPGYFRAFVADETGCESYVPRWQVHDSARGIYKMTLPAGMTLSGLVEAGWPCRRYGLPTRTFDGEEVWLPSPTIEAVGAGAYRWCVEQGILYARADGSNLNQRPITLVTGLIERVYQTLRTEWVAAGVHFDVLAPLRYWVEVQVSYELASGASQSVTEQQMRRELEAYVLTLPMGYTFAPDVALERVLRVSAVAGARVDAPVVAVTPPPNAVIRLSQVQFVRLNNG